MSSPHEDLHHLVVRLPGHVVGELLSFARYLDAKEQGGASVARRPAERAKR